MKLTQRIGDQDESIKRMTEQCGQLEHIIFELKQTIKRKQDVEEQLRIAREHENQMDQAKQEL